MESGETLSDKKRRTEEEKDAPITKKVAISTELLNVERKKKAEN